MAETEKRDLRLDLADRLIEQIEQGTARWQRPWAAGEILAPVNVVTGKPYRGVNYQNLMIFSPDPSDPRWCTYKQARDQGWQVRQGASGLPLEVWKEYEHKRTEEEIQRLKEQGVTDPEPTERRLGVRYYTAFHASQIDGIPPLERPKPEREMEGRPDDRLPRLAEAMGVELRYGGGRAFYRPSEDRVQMPPVESFERAAGHDTTLLHELSHATGHERRLNRDLKNSFGSEKYAIEELRAEMSAAMTAVSLGIGFDPAAQNVEMGREQGNSASYLASWLRALPEKDRKKTIVDVIKEAEQMSDYLLERTPEVDRNRLVIGNAAVELPEFGRIQGNGFVLTRNAEREGLEVQFEKKPDQEILDTLKSGGFRWSRGQGLWYARDSEQSRQAVAQLLPESERDRVLPRAREMDDPRAAVSRGDYVRYRNESGQEVEGVVLDDARPGEATRLRRIYRWPDGTPGLDGADHIAPTVLPNDLVEHIPGAVTPGPDLDAIDPNTDTYKRSMGMDDSRAQAQRAVLSAVEAARGQPERLAPEAEKAPLIQVGDFVITRRNQFGADWNTFSIVIRIDDSEVRLQDLYRSGREWEVAPAGRMMSREDFDADLIHQVSGVVPPEIASEKLDFAASRDRFVGVVRAFDAEHSLMYGKAPEPLTKVPDEVRPFLGSRQASVTDQLLRNSEEKGFFSDKMRELQEIIRRMPATYETDGLPDAERTVSLRYFASNGAQWFILEKDRGDPANEGNGYPNQTQAFGLADLGMGQPELGYIDIPEITRAGAELDYHFEPRTLLEIKQQHYPDLLPPELRPADLRKEQALREYQAFYAQLPQREEKLVTAVRERSERLAPADFRGFSDMMRDFRKGVDEAFGILREGEDRGASAPELRLAQAFTPEEIPDLPAVQTAHDQARRLGERFHDLDREIRDTFKARLRAHGKALLESGSLREPREIAQATYWKHGIEVSPDSPMIGKVVEAIRDKDLKTLLGMIGHNSQNPGSEEVFTRITGVKLGKTQKERVAQLLEWAGPEKAQALRESNALAEREREARGLRDGVADAWADLKGLRVNVGGQVVNGQEYVTLKVAGGQDRIASGKEGAATTYHLVNDRGEYSRVKDVRFTAFAKRVLAMDADGMVRNALEKAGIDLGIAQKQDAVISPEPGKPALFANFKNHEGDQCSLTLNAVNGALQGHLSRKHNGEVEHVPVGFHRGELGGLRAEAEFANGQKMMLSLSSSEASENREKARLELRVFERGADLTGKETLVQVHGEPAMPLQINQALEKTPDHAEGKLVEKFLGKDSQKEQKEQQATGRMDTEKETPAKLQPAPRLVAAIEQPGGKVFVTVGEEGKGFLAVQDGERKSVVPVDLSRRDEGKKPALQGMAEHEGRKFGVLLYADGVNQDRVTAMVSEQTPEGRNVLGHAHLEPNREAREKGMPAETMEYLRKALGVNLQRSEKQNSLSMEIG